MQGFPEKVDAPLLEPKIEFVEELDLRGVGVVGHLCEATGDGPLLRSWAMPVFRHRVYIHTSKGIPTHQVACTLGCTAVNYMCCVVREVSQTVGSCTHTYQLERGGYYLVRDVE